MTGGVKSACERIFREVAIRYDFTIYKLEVQVDHVHLFVGFKPSVSVSRVVQLFKDISRTASFKSALNCDAISGADTFGVALNSIVASVT